MASVIRRVRRTRVKLEHGYDVGAWFRHGSMHPRAVRKRAAMSRVTMAARSTKMPAVVDRLTRVHEQLDEHFDPFTSADYLERATTVHV